METISKYLDDFDNVPIDSYWNFGDLKEDLMHQIHAYPAKFPSFITTKAINYAEKSNVNIDTIGDFFCGCGTVAYEAAKKGYNFWGCDINPVAALIARVKSRKLDSTKLEEYYSRILSSFERSADCSFYKNGVNDRILYWFEQEKICELYRLLVAIENECREDQYFKEFFLVAFSNILKATSRWLTKSIKPQVDPNKISQTTLFYFSKQFRKMYKANNESNIDSKASVDIQVLDSLKITQEDSVDLLVSSPPYVTSYEYADLHQLSILWLKFGEDYKVFRKDTIGSVYEAKEEDINSLNSIGRGIVNQLTENGEQPSRVRAVQKYYSDMERIAKNAFSLLRKNGMVLFVIGNTEHKAVKIRNAEHLALALSECGFHDIQVSRRKISNKILTPYRDKSGKFSKNSNGKKIYSEEFIIIGRK